MMNYIRVGYIGQYSPHDRKALSGTPYKIGKALESIGCEIKWIPFKPTMLYRICAKIALLKSRITHERFLFSHTVIGATLLSKSIDRRMLHDCDIVFSPFASEPLYGLKTNKPIIYLSDATFSIMVGYYFKGLTDFSVRQGNKIEQMALDRASEIIVGSTWAKDSVINDYHQPVNKVHVIEFGANIDEKDIVSCSFKYENHLDLLFLGVDWERKGGEIAVEACRYLNENGIKAILHIVGVRTLDENIKELPYINYIGFLDKNIPEQYGRLVKIIERCHCLLLPTLAECAGIAFCESSANGLPVFSHETGGVRNYVEDARNGYLLPLGSTGEDFGRKIKECFESGELERMSCTAKDVYDEKLNWRVWAEKVRPIISRAVEYGRK